MPGEWVDRPHACRAEFLPIWIAPELWRIELDDPVDECQTRLFAPRGRLLANVAGWDEQAACAFARNCGDRVRALLRQGRGDALLRQVLAADAAGFETAASANVAGYVAARTAALLSPDEHAALVERRRQADWLAGRLRLEPVTSPVLDRSATQP
jgi:hypothetical protein